MTIKIIFSALVLTLLTTAFTDPDSVSVGDMPPAIMDKKGHTFVHFLSYFKKQALPYTLRPQDMEGYEKGATRDIPTRYTRSQGNLSMPSFKEIAEIYIPGTKAMKFSRMGPPVVLPVARFYPDDQSVAIVYELRNRYGSVLTRNYHLSYFDLKGNLINPPVKTKKSVKPIKGNGSLSGMLVASSGYLTTTGFHIDTDGRVKVVNYDNDWKLDPSKNSFEKNKLLGFKKVKEAHYILDPKSGVLQFVEIRTCGTVHP